MKLSLPRSTFTWNARMAMAGFRAGGVKQARQFLRSEGVAQVKLLATCYARVHEKHILAGSRMDAGARTWWERLLAECVERTRTQGAWVPWAACINFDPMWPLWVEGKTPATSAGARLFSLLVGNGKGVARGQDDWQWDRESLSTLYDGKWLCEFRAMAPEGSVTWGEEEVDSFCQQAVIEVARASQPLDGLFRNHLFCLLMGDTRVLGEAMREFGLTPLHRGNRADFMEVAGPQAIQAYLEHPDARQALLARREEDPWRNLTVAASYWGQKKEGCELYRRARSLLDGEMDACRDEIMGTLIRMRQPYAFQMEGEALWALTRADTTLKYGLDLALHPLELFCKALGASRSASSRRMGDEWVAWALAWPDAAWQRQCDGRTLRTILEEAVQHEGVGREVLDGLLVRDEKASLEACLPTPACMKRPRM